MTVDTTCSLRVLIVEDEALVAMLLEDMLTDFGCSMAGLAATVDQALALVQADGGVAYDFAILDVNLGGVPIFPVAEALAQLGKPFAFATGYGAAGLPDAWRGRPTLQKPFSAADVERLITQAR